MAKITDNKWVMTGLIVVVVGGLAGALTYWIISSGRLYTDAATISAPVTKLIPSSPGVIQQVFVNVGDLIPANTVVARVGDELLKTKAPSVVVDADTAIGTAAGPSTAVVSVINPADLRVVAHIDEDKGLSSIKVGDQAVFTVDAFGSKRFQGIVDEISPTARQDDVVFNISDKRQINQFDVKIRFDTTAYPQLKNGMSAKLWIYK